MEQSKLFDDFIELPIDTLQCKLHRWTTSEDFIDVTIKKTGKIVKRCIYCERIKLDNKRISAIEWKEEKEKLSDYYVKRMLTYGKNRLKMQDIPETLVEVKKAVMKVKRLVDKMNAPLKKCSKHGNLYRDDVIKSGVKKNGEQNWKCQKCMKELHQKHYELNKVKILIQHADYRKNNQKKIKEIRKKYNVKKRKEILEDTRKRWETWEARNPEKRKVMDKRYRDKAVDCLLDSYVKKQLLKTMPGMKTKDLPEPLISAAKAIMKLKRNVKIKKGIYKLNREITKNVKDQ